METFLWVEKYRPKTIDNCILPENLKTTFSEFVKDKHIPNLILSGGPGVGKTTVAKAMLNEIGATSLLINGSEESGIDVLRNKIKNFASTVSLEGGRKYVILDEADYLNPQSTQPALRGFMEEFHKNCGFILTCNYKNRLIEPLHSRCAVVDFSINGKEKDEIMLLFFKRLKSILDKEGVESEVKVLAKLISKHFPDWRRVLNECQRYAVSGKIDSGILVTFSDVAVNDVIKNLKDKNFPEVRKWVNSNLDNDSNVLLRRVYDGLTGVVDGPSIAAAVLIVAKYQYQSAFVADQEINLLAAMTEIMVECEFK